MNSAFRRSFCRDHDRFEGHAANWAGARTDLPNFGVHRASIDGALRNWLGRFRFVREIALRLSNELSAAAGRAEVIGLPLMFGAMRRSVRIYRHTADDILHEMRRGDGAVEQDYLAMCAVIVMVDVSTMDALNRLSR